ncbi:O-antigen ligase family protein [Microbacterium excoecariae]|uniref:O-antigen ligase family protein n=1 Tax=Microbacterium excoecariae TaxID=2715210 RepID=UPI00140A12C0|nr:O-antigen ligase family protein [Microbacterium excoecariae]NHI17458.1 O-antigen ligase family protein [Microbacterium excoecariae]
MAHRTRHPVAPAPRAPRRESTAHLALRAYATFMLFSALAYSWWYNLLGAVGAAALIAACVLGTLGIWIPHLARRRGRRAYPWRRLPWVALAYVALALASTAWSAWPLATVGTGAVMVAFTLQALFLADMLTWGEIIRALEVALRWVLGASLAFEAWVALFVGHPILPNFFATEGTPDPHWYWVRGNLFDDWLVGDRIQGIVGNANLIGMLALLALIVFGARLRLAILDRASAETLVFHGLWIALALWMLARAGSATALAAGAVAAGVLLVALVMRRQRTARGRTRVYAAFTALAVALAAAAWALRGPVLDALGRDGGLTGRDAIWSAVWERAATHPVVGNGFSSPWVPWHPAFAGWIVDHDITVFQAHNMWLDAFLQLGALGVVLVASVYGSALWRAWFFAVDRPRWDAHAERAYSPLTLVPILVVWALLTQGLTESNPVMLWGWLVVVMFVAKLKVSPVLTHPDSGADIGRRRPRRGVPRVAEPAVTPAS